MNEYARINKFLEDHGHKVEGGWEFLTPGIAFLTVMEAVIEITEKIERMPGYGCIPPKFPPDLPESMGRDV